MTNVNGIQPPMASRPLDPSGALPTGPPKVQAADISDVVEISEAARLVGKVQQMPDVRTELVESVKSKIAAGTYETPERIEIAVDRLIRELNAGL